MNPKEFYDLPRIFELFPNWSIKHSFFLNSSPPPLPKWTHSSTRDKTRENTPRTKSLLLEAATTPQFIRARQSIFAQISAWIRSSLPLSSGKIEARHVHEYFIDNTAKHEPSEISNLSPLPRIIYTDRIVPVIYPGFRIIFSKGFERCTRLRVETVYTVAAV